MIRLFRCLLLLFCAPPVLAAPDPADPRFDACILCHGTEGRGNERVSAPRIGGMEAWYLENQLQAFRRGWRGSHALDKQGMEMRPMALALEGRRDVEDAADLFASFPVRTTPDRVRGDPERGRELYDACVACHGEDARGDPWRQAPALAHQSDWYLVTQLQHYRDGIRGSDPNDTLGNQMQALAATLPDDQAVRDLVAYINTLD